MYIAKQVSKCWPFVTEDGGNIDRLDYKLDVGDLSAKTDAQTAITSSNSKSLTQMEA